MVLKEIKKKTHICFDSVARIPFLLCSATPVPLCAEDCLRLSSVADDHRYLMNGKDPAQQKLSQASFLSFLLYGTMMLQTKHRKNYLLFGSGSSKLHSFVFSTSENSSDHRSIKHRKRHLPHHMSELMVLKCLRMLLQ